MRWRHPWRRSLRAEREIRVVVANEIGANPRMQAEMEAVAAKAGWTPGVGATGQGIGLAWAVDTGSWVAEVARVSVDETTA